MGDCYKQTVRGSEVAPPSASAASAAAAIRQPPVGGDGGNGEHRNKTTFPRLKQISVGEFLTDSLIGDITNTASRLRGGGCNGDAELGNEAVSIAPARGKLERASFEELSDSQQVITSLQVNSKTLPSNFNKRPSPNTGKSSSKQQTSGEQVVIISGEASDELEFGTNATATATATTTTTTINAASDGTIKHLKRTKKPPRVLDPAGSLYYHWSAVVSFAFLYNFWSLSYRFAFCEIDFDSMAFWFALDYSADIIYVLDVIVNHHTGYLEDGVLERNLDKIGQHYRDCTLFYLDCLCLLPLDVLYLSIGFNSILRCSRLVKIYKFWSYVDRTERHTNYPNVFRTFTLVHYILVIFHWNACLFHMISKNRLIDIEGLYKISDNRCHDILCQYLHAFYWSTLALTTIGDLPRPRTKGEYVYVTVELFFGLFLFASVLGHVANIVTNVSAARKEFQAKLDAVKTFMRMRRVSDELQNKVIRWFDYLWISQQSSDEERSVACLPDRLKAEIAIHVHLDTLKRVDIFQNTEAGFLCELVLRLKPVLFSPGDYVCRKNEVGHEMYIVSRGILEVVTNEGATVVATLKAGSYFGEISVLNVGLAGNKRTASVRSVGYSDLFCLNKQDLWDVLKNYPNAEARIRARAEERLSKLDINSANQQQSSHYLRLPENKIAPYQVGSQSLSGNLNGSARHRRRVCSSGSRQKLAQSANLQLMISGHTNCIPQVKGANEQVLASCCYCCCSTSHLTNSNSLYQRHQHNHHHNHLHHHHQQHRHNNNNNNNNNNHHHHHHSNMTACHLLDANLARRDELLASHFATFSSNLALANSNLEQANSFPVGHSKSLDQANNNTITAEMANLAETNKHLQYNQTNNSNNNNNNTSNQSREEPDESDRLVGATSQNNSSRDESPGGELGRLDADAQSNSFGSHRGRSRAPAALKRIGSADELGAFRYKTSERDAEQEENEPPRDARMLQVAGRQPDEEPGHLSLGSMDDNSSCCLIAAGCPQRPSCYLNHSTCQEATCSLADPFQIHRFRLGGSRRERRRRRAANKHHCCARSDEQQDELGAYLHQQAQPALWWPGAQASFQGAPATSGSAAPFLQAPLLAAQAADGSYRMLQPVMASAHQSVSMTQLNVHQQVPPGITPTSSTVSPRPFEGAQYRPPIEGALSFSGINWQHNHHHQQQQQQQQHHHQQQQRSARTYPGMNSSGDPNASGERPAGESPPSSSSVGDSSAITTSQRAHPPLQAAQSGLEGSGGVATDVVVIDTE